MAAATLGEHADKELKNLMMMMMGKVQVAAATLGEHADKDLKNLMMIMMGKVLLKSISLPTIR